jgi:methyltransferase-like protein
LEIGCAAGGNIIPQALSLPEATFLGIDLSERQIDRGKRLVEELGQTNIELRQANLMEIDESWGQFDYIISHGVFSWMPSLVQDKLLEVSARNLTPNGVAFVSYNTFPGWHLANVVRDLMQYHAGKFEDALKKIEQAKAILEFLVGLGDDKRACGKLLKDELDILRKVDSDAYLFHEHLETYNSPLYFYQFMERAEAAGLQYLADADFSTMLLQNLPPQAREPFGRLPLLQQEQYMDFIRGRRFRKTLLCRREVELRRNITAATMKQFHFSLTAPVAFQNVDIRNERPVEFTAGDGKLTTTNRVMKAAMLLLQEAQPRSLPFAQLYAAALARAQQTRPLTPNDPDATPDGLGGALLQGYAIGMLEISLHPPRWVGVAGQRPQASPLARLQAAHGVLVTNLRHMPIGLDPLSQRVVRRLDGRHDREALMPCVHEAIAAGEVCVRDRDKPVADPDPALLAGILDKSLGVIAQSALLVD